MEATTFYPGVVLLTIFLVYVLLLGARQRRLNLPPTGPLALPVIGHLHLLWLPLHQTLARISARHGPLLLLRFGSRPVLLVSSPTLAEECFTKNDIAFSNRPATESSKYLTYNYTSLGGAPYGAHWRNLRRITSLHVFSSNRIAALSSIREDEIRSLLHQLFRAPITVDGFRRLEIRSKLSELTFNTMMQMVVGKRYYGESTTVDLEERRRFRRIVEEVFQLFEVSNPEDFLPFMKWVVKSRNRKRLETVERDMDELFQNMIEERRKVQPEAAEGDKKKTILDVLMSLQRTDPGCYTDELIKGIIQIVILGGTESSSGVMEWAMSLLLNHPEVFKEARAEIDAQVGLRRLVTDADLTNLPYLNNVIKETLRLFPIGPLLLPRESTTDCSVGGYDIPRGTLLLVNMYAISRDPDLWTDPTEFKPERWFQGGVSERYKYIPFGSGRRRCPGEALANRMMGLALGALIQCFEWEPIGEKEVDLTEGASGLTMPKAVPLEAMYKPREDMINILSQL